VGLEAHLHPPVFPQKLPRGLQENLVAPGFRLGLELELRQDAPVRGKAQEAPRGIQGKEGIPQAKVTP